MEFLPARRTLAVAPLSDFGGGGDDEIELSLGLAVGRSVKKPAEIAGGPGRSPEVGENLKGGAFWGQGGILAEDRAAMEVKSAEARARDRSCREAEAETEAERWGVGRKGLNGVAALISPQIASPNSSNSMQYSVVYPACNQQVQYVPVHTGLGFPYMVPCWAPTISPVAGGGGAQWFQNVYHGPPPPPEAVNGGVGCKNAGNCVEVKDGVLSAAASLGSCSSGVSEHRCSSFRGGSVSSSSSRSHSSWPAEKPAEQPQVCKPDKHQLSPMAVPQLTLDTSSAKSYITPSSHSPVVAAGTVVEQPKPPIRSNEVHGLVDHKSPVLNSEDGRCKEIPSMHQMPCVSATGNGPNGKTITGVLYKYTKSEVSIVCVCHGTSFTPAEFVQHAGGTDMSHPLKQIVVVPF